jgi:hypothetical protein
MNQHATQTVIVICVIGALCALLFVPIVIKFSARMVAGITPTYASAVGAFLSATFVNLLIQAILFGLNVQLNSPGAFLAVTFLGFLSQAAVYSGTLKNVSGVGVTFGQSCLIILFLFPVALALGVVVVLVMAVAGFTLISFDPRHPLAAFSSRPAPVPTPAPAPALMQRHAARLKTPITVSTQFGAIAIPAGASVEILGSAAGGYRARVSGTEVTLTDNQVAVQ